VNEHFFLEKAKPSNCRKPFLQSCNHAMHVAHYRGESKDFTSHQQTNWG